MAGFTVSVYEKSGMRHEYNLPLTLTEELARKHAAKLAELDGLDVDEMFVDKEN
jgi:hypothetical protein